MSESISSVPGEVPSTDANAVVKFKTFAITLRPRDGITMDQCKDVLQWIRKRSEYYRVVTEKRGCARHLHAAMFLKVAVTRSNFSVVFTRLLRKFELDSEELVVAAKGIRILYSSDFITSYLNKDDDTEVLGDNMPEAGKLTSWFPPKVETIQKKGSRHSAYYWHLESLWMEHRPPAVEVDTVNMRNFLFDMMYNKRLIAVIRDDKAIIQTARHLCRWVKREHESTIHMAPFELEE